MPFSDQLAGCGRVNYDHEADLVACIQAYGFVESFRGRRGFEIEMAVLEGAWMVSRAPGLVFAFEARVQVGPPLELGPTIRGIRRIVPILGGTFEGPELKGRVLPGGADWQIIHADGFSELDTRYTLEADGGELIYVQNRGVRHAPPEVMRRLLAGETVDPLQVYFRTTPIFETAAPNLQWLTRSLFVGTGERQPLAVVIRFWRMI
jgi:hypothetical protein